MIKLFFNKKVIISFAAVILIILAGFLLYKYNFDFSKIIFKNNQDLSQKNKYITEKIERNINEIGDLSNVLNLFVRSSSTENNPIVADVFKNTQLETLGLAALGYEEIPNEIGNLVNLKYLYLNDNKLKTLPDSLKNLKNLEFLNISGNQFEKIPEVVYELKNLKKLFAVNNKNLSQTEQEKLVKAFPGGVVVVDANLSEINKKENLDLANSVLDKKGIDRSKLKPEIPYGSQTFQVYQNENALPKIWEVKIDPPDVRVGQKQKLSIIVEGPYEIKEVKAITRLDNSTKTIDLIYKKDVSEKDLSSRKYAVLHNNLILKNNIANLFQNIFSTIFASESTKKLYEAEWTVEDTHDTVYYTTFYVSDARGNKNSITLAWSDACGIPNGGNWTIPYNCTIGSPDGVDNGNVTIQTYTLTLNSTFVWNPGNSITINSGAIAVGSGGSLQQAYLYLQDADNDNYTPQSSYTQFTNSNSSWSSPYKRRNLFSSLGYSDCDDYNASVQAGLAYYSDSDGDSYGYSYYGTFCSSPGGGYVANNSDCYDYNANARPGNTTYFTANRGDGSFDYNCDNQISYQYGNASYVCMLSSDGQSCGAYFPFGGGAYISGSCSPSSCTTRNCTIQCYGSISVSQVYCGSTIPVANSASCITSIGAGSPNACATPVVTSFNQLLGCY